MKNNKNNSHSPSFLEDVENTDSQLRKIKLWKCVTKLEVKQQRLEICLLLPNNACQACTDIFVPRLTSENGSNILLDKIKVFMQRTYILWPIWHMIKLRHFIVQFK